MPQLYAPPPEIETQVFTRLPEHLHYRGEPNEWVRATRPGQRLHSFLEGPAFDRDGHLYCCDVPHGRIFRIAPDGAWSVAIEYDGEPNGLKIHRDGRVFIADHHKGILAFDPRTSRVEKIVTRVGLDSFRGCNDLFFGADGDLYFTDPGRSSLSDPTGRVYRYTSAGRLELLLDNVPYPNGLVLNLEETQLMIAATRANCIWRCVANSETHPPMTGLFVQLSGGLAGPDGLALDAEGNLAIAHAQHGTVWLFSRFGEPLARIRSCAGRAITNVAYGGPDRRTLYITEAETGSILTAQLEVPGKPMFSHT
jgi:gluconolactonase